MTRPPESATAGAPPVGVAVVGCGYWGPNVVRNLSALDEAAVRILCDVNAERLEQLHRRFPAARAVRDFREILDADDVDAVAICTPVDTHYPLASAALSAGKHVMIEKPMTRSVESAQALVDLAERNGLVLHVDHTFVYGGAVQKIRSIIDSGDMGDLLYLDSVRINLGLFQSDVNVVWDLAAHDASIMTYLIDEDPVWVSAIGSAHYGKHESQAYVTIKFRDSLLAHLHVNWLAPVKLRSTLIGGSRRMIVYDDLEPSEKLRVYDKGVTLTDDPGHRARALVDYRVGDMFAPYIDKSEPLGRACRAFVEAIRSGGQTLTSGRDGLRVVRLLDAAERSIRKEGERIHLEHGP